MTGGQLQMGNPVIGSSDTVPHVSARVGGYYDFELFVERYPALPTTARILFGGVEIYNKNGTGAFAGRVRAINTNGLVILANSAGQWYLDYIRITEV